MKNSIPANSLLAAEAVSKILPSQQFGLWESSRGAKRLPRTHIELLHFRKKRGT